MTFEGIMTRALGIRGHNRERGFTLLEALLVVGLTTLVTVGLVAGLLEGLDALHEITDMQGVDFGHQKAMRQFTRDVQAATWFYGGTVHSESDPSGPEVPSEATRPHDLVMGYAGPDGNEVWVRYRTRGGSFSSIGETYLVRTVLCDNPAYEGSSVIGRGVANLFFTYYDADGKEVFRLPEIRRIRMTLSLATGGAALQREYDVTMRNPNLGVKSPRGDFDAVEDQNFLK
jgi:type II secretory pathway pseudopilin PulG